MAGPIVLRFKGHLKREEHIREEQWVEQPSRLKDAPIKFRSFLLPLVLGFAFLMWLGTKFQIYREYKETIHREEMP